jgi:protein translocase SecG subunit
MDITLILKLLQVLVSLFIIALVMLQQQNSGFYSSTSNINRSRRGPEKLVYNLTIISGIVFVIITTANILFNK